MDRIFWPVAKLNDLPDAGEVLNRLSRWVRDWFGSARLESSSVVAGPPRSRSVATGLASGDVLAGMAVDPGYTGELMEHVPELRLSDAVLDHLAQDALTDLYLTVFSGDPSALEEMQRLGKNAKLPLQVMRLNIRTDRDNRIAVLLSADFVMPRPKAAPPSTPQALQDKITQSKPVAVRARLTGNCSIDHLMALTKGDVLPLTSLDDSPVTLCAGDTEICTGYIGRSGDNKALLLVQK